MIHPSSMPAMRWPFFALFLTALGFTLFMALSPRPPHTIFDQQDKLLHIAAFATLALLSALAFPRASLLRIGERLSFLGALVEVVQTFPAIHRDCDIWDWVFDTEAILLALLLLGALRVVPSR